MIGDCKLQIENCADVREDGAVRVPRLAAPGVFGGLLMMRWKDDEMVAVRHRLWLDLVEERNPVEGARKRQWESDQWLKKFHVEQVNNQSRKS